MSNIKKELIKLSKSLRTAGYRKESNMVIRTAQAAGGETQEVNFDYSINAMADPYRFKAFASPQSLKITHFIITDAPEDKKDLLGKRVNKAGFDKLMQRIKSGLSHPRFINMLLKNCEVYDLTYNVAVSIAKDTVKGDIKDFSEKIRKAATTYGNPKMESFAEDLIIFDKGVYSEMREETNTDPFRSMKERAISQSKDSKTSVLISRGYTNSGKDIYNQLLEKLYAAKSDKDGDEVYDKVIKDMRAAAQSGSTLDAKIIMDFVNEAGKDNILGPTIKKDIGFDLMNKVLKTTSRG